VFGFFFLVYCFGVFVFVVYCFGGFVFVFYFFSLNWGLNSGLRAAKQALYCLSHNSSPLCSEDQCLMSYLLGLNQDSPDLSLPCS
jgi:hypothetical protein